MENVLPEDLKIPPIVDIRGVCLKKTYEILDINPETLWKNRLRSFIIQGLDGERVWEIAKINNPELLNVCVRYLIDNGHRIRVVADRTESFSFISPELQ